MRHVRAAVAIIAWPVLSGCGYIHFGRLPATPRNDAALTAAYSDLSTEHKMLRQELALARKEGDALRLALERAGGGASTDSGNLVARLNEATQELATLRASYTKLRNERAAAAPPATQENSAPASREQSALQEENTRLRADVARLRAENVSLAEQLKFAARQEERTRDELAHLNAELLALKEARAGAAPATAEANSLSSALQQAKAPPAGSSPAAELRREATSTRD